MVELHLFPEHAPALFVHLVVRQIQREQGGVVVQELNQVVDAAKFLTVKGQLVALKIQIFQGLVLLQGLAELGGTLGAEEIAFELQLSEGLVSIEHFGENHTTAFFDILSANMNGFQSMIISKVLSNKFTFCWVEFVDAAHCELEWSVLLIQGLHDHLESTTEVTVLLLGSLSLCFLLLA